MNWFGSKDSTETTLTIQPHNLENHEPFARAKGKLAELRQQENELAAQLVEARTRMHRLCEGQAIPPPNHDQKVCELDRQLRACRAQIPQAEDTLRSLEAAPRIANSRAAKPAHDRLRRNVIHSLEQLRDALAAEQHFRDNLDFSTDVLTAVCIPIFSPYLDTEALEDAINAQKGYLL